MMASAQSFISGAISKTINLPNDVSLEDIGRAYLQSWKRGLKATALYRDGCKLSQPLSTTSDAETEDDETVVAIETSVAAVPAAAMSPTVVAASAAAPEMEGAPKKAAAEVVADGSVRVRRPMPGKRRGFTQEAKVGGHKLYLRTGEYEDGSLGEIFIDMHKEGAAFRGIANCFAIAISKGLQYGVPLEEFVETFTFTRFAPQGQVQGHPNLRMATSVLDYVFRVLGLEYLDRTDLVHVKPSQMAHSDPGEGELSAAADANANADAIAIAIAKGGEPAELTGRTIENRPERPERPDAPQAKPQVTALLEGKSELEEGVFAVRDTSRLRVPAAAAQPDQEFAAQALYSEQLSDYMGDAPTCSKCGQFTIRSGSCYRCLFCGESEGCS